MKSLIICSHEDDCKNYNTDKCERCMHNVRIHSHYEAKPQEKCSKLDCIYNFNCKCIVGVSRPCDRSNKEVI